MMTNTYIILITKKRCTQYANIEYTQKNNNIFLLRNKFSYEFHNIGYYLLGKISTYCVYLLTKKRGKMLNMYENSLSSNENSFAYVKAIPHVLYQTILNNAGKPDRIAIELLAEIWYWHRKKIVKDKDTGEFILKNKFQGAMFSTSYLFLQAKIGCSKDSINEAFKKLENLGFVKRYTKNVILGKEFIRKKFCIGLTNYFRKFYNLDENYEAKCSQEITSDPESEIPTIYKDYYKYYNNRSKDDLFFKNEKNIEENSCLESTSKIKIQTVNLASISIEELLKEVGRRGVNANITAEEGIINSNDASSTSMKNSEKPFEFFLPLSEEDCKKLRELSGRNFTDKGINEIAKGMIPKVKHASFKFKLGFVSYFSPALRQEARPEELVNRDDFDGTFNYGKVLNQQNRQEKYLRELEYSLDTSPEMHLKKKLAATLATPKAYHLLTSISQMFVDGEKFVFSINEPINLHDGDEKIILNQVKAVYSYASEDLGVVAVSGIEFRIKKDINVRENSFEKEFPNNVWGKIRGYLHRTSGLRAIENRWLKEEKVTARIDDLNKTVALRAGEVSIRDGVKKECTWLLEKTAAIFGYEYIGIELERWS